MSFERIIISGKEYDLVPVKPVVADNPFMVGDYVKITTAKRPGHRQDGTGKVVANVATSKWDDQAMPMVYIEFPNSFSGCGNATARP